jgi:hypothetical protein
MCPTAVSGHSDTRVNLCNSVHRIVIRHGERAILFFRHAAYGHEVAKQFVHE